MRTGLNLIRMLLASVYLCVCLPILAQAQTALTHDGAMSHTFSYSILDTEIDNHIGNREDSAAFLQTLQRDVLAVILEPRATVFALWLPVEKPDDVPFAGLAPNQIGLMLAWPDGTAPTTAALDRVLTAEQAVSASHTRLFEPVFLTDGLNVPTQAGFYVHREEHYGIADVDEAVRLSQEAWVTWEPAFGVEVIGLFREVPVTEDFVNLNRIVWYPDYAGWLGTRNTTTDPESARRFRDRRQLLIEGSGIAIATDRALPQERD